MFNNKSILITGGTGFFGSNFVSYLYKKFKPKKAILTHLGAWLDYDDLKKLCPNNVEPGYDGLTHYLT